MNETKVAKNKPDFNITNQIQYQEPSTGYGRPCSENILIKPANNKNDVSIPYNPVKSTTFCKHDRKNFNGYPKNNPDFNNEIIIFSVMCEFLYQKLKMKRAV